MTYNVFSGMLNLTQQSLREQRNWVVKTENFVSLGLITS